MSPRGKKVFKVVTVIMAVTIVIVAVWIMATGRGLSEQYDFGAGAYYYADIPGYEQVVRDDLYKPRLPYIVYVLLFLLWGWLMYRLWKRLDK